MAAISALPADRSWLDRRARVARAILPLFCFGVLPVLVTLQILAIAARHHAFAVDFHYAFWPAGRHVLAGESPFPPPTVAALVGGTAFVYPAPAALLLAPFALVPQPFADVLFTALLVVAGLGALRVLGIRDRRCYGAIFLWAPVFAALQTANLSLLLAFGLAVLWRYRDRTLGAAAATAALICLKLFLWPLVLWLVATRRYASACYALAAAFATTFGAWAVLGFAGLGDYVPTVRLLAELEQRAGYTPLAFALELGLPFGLARAAGLALAAAVLGAAVLVAHRRRADAASFALVVAATLLLSPIVWLHYFALLIVPVAILRPRFAPLWLLPVALWICPVRPAGPTWLAGFALLVLGAMLVLALRPRAAAPRLPAAVPAPSA